MIIFSPQLGLSPKSILGGEVFDREILLGLAKRGFKINLLLPNNKPHDKGVKNWHIDYLPISRFPAQIFNVLTIPYLLRMKNTDVLRLHQPQFLVIPALFVKLTDDRVKIIATYHKFEESRFGPFTKRINNLWDHIICDSEAVKNKLVKHYSVPKTKITVVHNGVPNFLKPQKKDPKLVKKYNLGNKTVLLFMGLFVERKNPLFLIDVVQRLSQKHIDVVLIFLGKGPLEKDMIKKAKDLNVQSRVKILKPVFGPQKNKIHNLADIFVHPSLDEGFALAPLEAMACAKPIIITKGYSANEAVEDNHNGYICKANDIDNWSDRIAKIVQNPSKRISMGKASQKKADEEFSWKIAIEKHISVLKTLQNKSV